MGKKVFLFGFEGILRLLLHLIQISAVVVVAPAAIVAAVAVAVAVDVGVADAAVDVVAAVGSAIAPFCS